MVNSPGPGCKPCGVALSPPRLPPRLPLRLHRARAPPRAPHRARAPPRPDRAYSSPYPPYRVYWPRLGCRTRPAGGTATQTASRWPFHPWRG